MHGLHVVLPGRSWNMPASQLVQISALELGLNVPGAQGVARAEPTGQNVPGGQITH